jgi:hypothetical protein
LNSLTLIYKQRLIHKQIFIIILVSFIFITTIFTLLFLIVKTTKDNHHYQDNTDKYDVITCLNTFFGQVIVLDYYVVMSHCCIQSIFLVVGLNNYIRFVVCGVVLRLVCFQVGLAQGSVHNVGFLHFILMIVEVRFCGCFVNIRHFDFGSVNVRKTK